jgi:integrase
MSIRTKGDLASNRQSGSDRRKYLQDTYVKTARAPQTGRLILSDEGQRGLWLRMSRGRDGKDHKVWFVRYRPRGQPQRAATIGLYPEMGLADARARASAICAAARKGRDLPAEEASALKAEAEARRRAGERPTSFDDLLDRYITGYCKANQRRWKMTERMFDRHVKPARVGGIPLGEKPLNELRRGDIVELLDDLQNEKEFGAQVNRVRAEVVAALNWAIEREWIEANPAAAIRKRKIEAPRERKLSDEELRTIWKAACRLTDPSSSFVRTLILTGQRRDEIRCMVRTEWDEKERLWTLPKERNKGRRHHCLPLSTAAIEILDSLPHLGPYFFTVTGTKPYAGTKRLKEILDRESGVTGWVFHDIRRTVRSGLARLNVREEVAELVLNHAKRGLVKVYNQHEYLDEMRAAMEKWADHVAITVGDASDASNVVSFPDKQAVA